MAVVELGGEPELKLLGTWASPWASRVKLALHLKGLSYEYIEQDLDNKSGLLLASNPVHKKVPVLIHNAKPICESRVILEYIDEVYSATCPSLLPVDPHERAAARFWVAYIDDKAFKANAEEGRTEAMNQTLAAAETLEGALKECSKGKPFFGGDGIGYVDVALGGLIAWLQGTEQLCGAKLFDDSKTPLLLSWMERFVELEAAKVALPDVGQLVEFAKMRLAQLAAAAATVVPAKK